MQRSARTGIAVAAIACLLLPAAAGADVFMKKKHHMDAFEMMGQKQPAKDSVESTWFTADRVRSDQENRSVILRLDKNAVLLVDHAKKTYMEIPLDMGKELPKEMKAMPGMSFKVTVKETGETKTINAWKCRKYLQETDMGMMPSTSEVWATEDLRIDPALYARYNAALFASGPGRKPAALEDMMKEWKKVKGVPVLTVTTSTIMNAKMTSSVELTEFREGKAPAGHFEVPAGYKKEAMP